MNSVVISVDGKSVIDIYKNIKNRDFFSDNSI